MAKNTVTGVRSAGGGAAPAPLKPSRGIAGKIVGVILAIVLGAGAAVGLTFLLAPQNLPDFLGGSGSGASVAYMSDLEVDADGNNLDGNRMDNLDAGGFVAMQGEHLFYADIGGDGGLCYQPPKGDIVRLTDFPVANLNISGNELVFTDLSHCFIFAQDEIIGVQGATHLELWNEAQGTDIQYGGNLYVLYGVKELCEGKIDVVQLLLTGIRDEGCISLSPIVSEGSIIVLTAPQEPEGATPMASSAADAYTIAPMASAAQGALFSRGVTPMAGRYRKYRTNHTYTDVTIYIPTGKTVTIPFGSDTKTIKNVSVYNAVVYVELQDGLDQTKNQIVRYEIKSDTIMDTINGYNLKDHDGKIFFVNSDDRMIYEHEPMTQKFNQVSSVACDGAFDITPEGNIAFSAYNQNTQKPVNVVVSRQDSHIAGTGSNRTVTTASGSMGSYHTYVNPPKTMLPVDNIAGSTRRGAFVKDRVFLFHKDDGFWYEHKLDRWKLPISPGVKLTTWASPTAPAGGFPTPSFIQTPEYAEYRREAWVKPLDELNREEMARIYPADQLDRILGTQSGGQGQQDQQGQQGQTDPNGQGQQQGQQGQQGQTPPSTDIVPSDASQALDALLSYIQGSTNYASNSKLHVYSQGRFAELLVYYGDDIQTRKIVTPIAADVMTEIGIDGRDDEIIEIFMLWFGLAKYQVGPASVSGDTATVTVTIQSHVNGKLVFEKLDEIAMEELRNYPGGQQALAAKGQDFVLNWMCDILVKVMSDPAAYDCISNTATTHQIEMHRDATLGWLVEKPLDLLDLLATMD